MTFHESRKPLLKHSQQRPVFDVRGPYVTAHCDVAVGAIVLDTPEAVHTLGAMQRFSFNPKSKNTVHDTGCILCHAPTAKYASTLEELTPEERHPRDPAEEQRLREEGKTTAMANRGTPDRETACKIGVPVMGCVCTHE